MKFTDENIEKLFGKSDAENEVPERLKEYFFKNKAYENLANDLSIRILVGHKGSGKSALLKILYLEDIDRKIPAIFLKPGDVLSAFDQNKSHYNSWIEDWKKTLTGLIVGEALKQAVPDSVEKYTEASSNTSQAIVGFLKSLIDKVVENGSYAVDQDIINRYKSSSSIRVYIDDLDRGWKATDEDVNKISTLLSAIRDLCGASNAIQFRVALRSDVYNLVRTSDESTDKIEDKIVQLKWTSHELLIIFAKRINTYFGINVSESDLNDKSQDQIATYYSKIIEERFHGKGKWSNRKIHKVILSMQRNRPRDIVKLLSGAAKQAYQNGNEIISTNDLESTFVKYSNERLQDIINEFKSELPAIERFLLELRPTKKTRKTSESFLYNQAQLNEKLTRAMGHVNLSFTNKKPVTPKSLGEFLYKIDFIIARKGAEGEGITRLYFDENRFISSVGADFGFSWEVHPAYRWALEPEKLEDIYSQISDDDD